MLKLLFIFVSLLVVHNPLLFAESLFSNLAQNSGILTKPELVEDNTNNNDQDNGEADDEDDVDEEDDYNRSYTDNSTRKNSVFARLTRSLSKNKKKLIVATIVLIGGAIGVYFNPLANFFYSKEVSNKVDQKVETGSNVVDKVDDISSKPTPKKSESLPPKDEKLPEKKQELDNSKTTTTIEDRTQQQLTTEERRHQEILQAQLANNKAIEKQTSSIGRVTVSLFLGLLSIGASIAYLSKQINKPNT